MYIFSLSMVHFLIILSLFIGCCLPRAYCQEKFSAQFKNSLQSLRQKIDILYDKSTEWSVLDVGANNGDWSDLVRKTLFTNASYFLIEGNAHYAKVFEEKRYRYEIGLVGDKEGEKVQFWVHKRYFTGGSISRENSTSQSGVPKNHIQSTHTLTTIDSIVARNSVKPPRLLKMDIQGSEFTALRGALNTLRSVDIAIIEVPMHQYNYGAATFTDLNLFMESQGFRIYDIADFRTEKFPYAKLRRGAQKMVSTLIQADVVWVKVTSPLISAAGFREPMPSKYSCTFTGGV